MNRMLDPIRLAIVAKPQPVLCKQLLIFCPAKDKRLSWPVCERLARRGYAES